MIRTRGNGLTLVMRPRSSSRRHCANALVSVTVTDSVHDIEAVTKSGNKNDDESTKTVNNVPQN